MALTDVLTDEEINAIKQRFDKWYTKVQEITKNEHAALMANYYAVKAGQITPDEGAVSNGQVMAETKQQLTSLWH